MSPDSSLHFEVKRSDLHECRVAEADVPDIDEGQALLRVDPFGFTSNNITYAAMGDAMRYWDFFSAAGEWGRIPVFGFANAIASAHDELADGKRIFGYLPMATHLVVTPARVDGRGFVDAAPHRAQLPPAYNSYQWAEVGAASAPEREAHRMLLWPLFFTSFLIDSYLEDAEFWGAGAIVLSSASSKTALGTAFLLSQRDDIEVVGLTSPGNADFVGSLGVYDRVVTYNALTSLPAERAVYVDVAGNGELREAIHQHYGDELAFSLLVGDTHWDQAESATGLPGPTPSFFFAPDEIRKRTRERDQDALEAELETAWTRFVEWTDSWFTVVRSNGPDAVQRVYLDHLDGRIDASAGHVLSMWS